MKTLKRFPQACFLAKSIPILIDGPDPVSAGSAVNSLIAATIAAQRQHAASQAGTTRTTGGAADSRAFDSAARDLFVRTCQTNGLSGQETIALWWNHATARRQ